jgi:hypothetical protein
MVPFSAEGDCRRVGCEKRLVSERIVSLCLTRVLRLLGEVRLL